LGGDGNFYLLDLARSLPPEDGRVASHLIPDPQSPFYRILRPEFLRAWKASGGAPLSPDALSRWGLEDSLIHNQAVNDATKRLIHVIIPDLATLLDSGTHSGSLVRGEDVKAKEHQRDDTTALVLREPISEELHRRGINCRHIGLLRSLITRNASARATLLVEVVSRTLKNLLRAAMRDVTLNAGSTSSDAHNDG
jgi:hypothetical protein